MNKKYEIIQEILLEEVSNIFKIFPDDDSWAVTTQQLIRHIQSNPLNDGILKRKDFAAIGEALQDLVGRGIVQPASPAGVWTFPRSAFNNTNK